MLDCLHSKYVRLLVESNIPLFNISVWEIKYGDHDLLQVKVSKWLSRPPRPGAMSLSRPPRLDAMSLSRSPQSGAMSLS